MEITSTEGLRLVRKLLIFKDLFNYAICKKAGRRLTPSVAAPLKEIVFHTQLEGNHDRSYGNSAPPLGSKGLKMSRAKLSFIIQAELSNTIKT